MFELRHTECERGASGPDVVKFTRNGIPGGNKMQKKILNESRMAEGK
jgi:hypothetical protein